MPPLEPFGRRGSAVRFSADGQDFTRTANMPAVTTVTVSGHFYLAVDRNTFSAPGGFFQNTNNYLFLETAADGVTMYLLAKYGGTEVTSAGVALTVGTWYYLAFTKTGTTHTLYYGAAGAALAAQTFSHSGSFTPTSFMLGESVFGAEWWNGRVAAVNVWSGVALSLRELEENRRYYVPVHQLGWYWSFPCLSGGTGPSANHEVVQRHLLSGGTGSTTEAGPPLQWQATRPARARPLPPATVGAMVPRALHSYRQRRAR